LRLILPIEQNKYEVANQRILKWLEEGIMTKEIQPAIFVSRQRISLDDKKYTRTGIIAAMRLYAYSENMVFPMNSPIKAPKADRLNMLRTVQKDLEPVFSDLPRPRKENHCFLRRNKPRPNQQSKLMIHLE